MPNPPAAIQTRVTEATEALTAVLPRLEAEIPEKKRAPYGGFGTGKGGHGPLCSWNTAAAMLVLEIHEGVREMEQNLRYHTSRVLRDRGDSDNNTVVAIAGIPALAAGARYDVASGACRKMESWCYRAALVLGDIDPVSRLPRLPGERDPKCPYCLTSGTLRVRHATGTVTCLRPSCKDSNGDRPKGRIEVGSFSREPIIAWQDGTTGVAALQMMNEMVRRLRGRVAHLERERQALTIERDQWKQQCVEQAMLIQQLTEQSTRPYITLQGATIQEAFRRDMLVYARRNGGR